MAAQLPKTMFAWRKHKGNPEPVWEEVPVPTVRPRGVLIKLLASGVCHSDHSLLTNENQRPWLEQKYTLGHEGCGEIIEIGDQIKDSGFQDQSLQLLFQAAERTIVQNARGISLNFAKELITPGIGQDGFYAPCAHLDIRAIAKVPGNIPSHVAAVATDAVKTSYHAIMRRGEVKPTETVVLFGLGGLGFNALQIVLHVGARVIVSDVRQERLDEAVKIGVPKEDAIPAGKSVQEFLKRRDLRRGGKMVCIGTLDTENTIGMKIGIRKRLTINFTYGGQIRDLKEVLELISMGVVQRQVETAGLKEFPVILKDLYDGKVKARVALVPQGS
ncbi:hypothetical protein LTR06_011178 [Exophiala xenobiotica]|nr:hypothetical protein LTR06_011178 [Exophiala xenobiotica]